MQPGRSQCCQSPAYHLIITTCAQMSTQTRQIITFVIYRKAFKNILKSMCQHERCAATVDVWKQRDCEHCWQKSQYENVVLCGPRQRSPVAWVNEVISRDGVSCHTSGTGFRIQSPSQASITGPPRQLTRRSNTVFSELSKSKTVVLRAIPFTDTCLNWDISNEWHRANMHS